MNDYQKSLKHCSLSIYLLITPDIARLVGGIVSDEYTFIQYKVPYVAHLGNFLLCVLMLLNFCGLFLKTYLATTGLKIAMRPTLASFHIVIAKFLWICSLIVSSAMLLNLIASGKLVSETLSTIFSVADTIVLFWYVRASKRVRSALIQM